jgi:hypothetical protein
VGPIAGLDREVTGKKSFAPAGHRTPIDVTTEGVTIAATRAETQTFRSPKGRRNYCTKTEALLSVC